MKASQWAAALAALAIAGAAWGQAPHYPSRPVRVVVAAATGGPDIVARVVAAKLQEQTGQPFVVENQPGANGIVGASTVAKAAPDGYTLLVYSSGFVINPYVHKSLPYDTEKDFIPVTNLVTNGGLIFAVNANLPVKTMKEFLAYAKQPGTQLSYSTPGVGNTWHLAMEVFDSLVGIKMTHIPYKGGGPATAAAAAGEVQVVLAWPKRAYRAITTTAAGSACSCRPARRRRSSRSSPPKCARPSRIRACTIASRNSAPSPRPARRRSSRSSSRRS